MSKGRVGAPGPTFLSYVLSFALLGEYWANHHLLQVARTVALVLPALSMAIYAAVVPMWLVPDRRIERAIKE